LADLADPFDYSTHKKQLILAKQLIENGADVNAVSNVLGNMPLHKACHSGAVTNLDFVELLLEEGADPNTQDHLGRTPLMYTLGYAPNAAKFLLNWPTTDGDITDESGASFLAMVRSVITYFSEQNALPENANASDRVEHLFVVQQWSEIKEMLVERGAVDTGIWSRDCNLYE
jgi:hypothetical protein